MRLIARRRARTAVRRVGLRIHTRSTAGELALVAAGATAGARARARRSCVSATRAARRTTSARTPSARTIAACADPTNARARARRPRRTSRALATSLAACASAPGSRATLARCATFPRTARRAPFSCPARRTAFPWST